MTAVELRLAREVFTWPVRPGPRWKAPRCPLCTLPFHENNEVTAMAGGGWVHPFCAGGGNPHLLGDDR